MTQNKQKPDLPIVLGSGPLADSMRAMIAEDPDRYRPETWSMTGHKCPCCGQKVFRCTTRHTDWHPGFATLDNAVHPSFDAQTKQPALGGTLAGCCCVAPNWGPKHQPKKKAKRRKK